MKNLTLCKFDPGDNFWSDYPFAEHDVFIFLGEISNMPDHCVVIRKQDNAMFSGYHTDNFIELTEDEL